MKPRRVPHFLCVQGTPGVWRLFRKGPGPGFIYIGQTGNFTGRGKTYPRFYTDADGIRQRIIWRTMVPIMGLPPLIPGTKKRKVESQFYCDAAEVGINTRGVVDRIR